MSLDSAIILESEECTRFHRRLRRVAFVVGIYFFYLAALGPFNALVSAGPFASLPRFISDACFLPATPVIYIPIFRGLFTDCLDWWYLAPNAPDMPTGW